MVAVTSAPGGCDTWLLHQSYAPWGGKLHQGDHGFSIATCRKANRDSCTAEACEVRINLLNITLAKPFLSHFHHFYLFGGTKTHVPCLQVAGLSPKRGSCFTWLAAPIAEGSEKMRKSLQVAVPVNGSLMGVPSGPFSSLIYPLKKWWFSIAFCMFTRRYLKMLRGWGLKDKRPRSAQEMSRTADVLPRLLGCMIHDDTCSLSYCSLPCSLPLSLEVASITGELRWPAIFCFKQRGISRHWRPPRKSLLPALAQPSGKHTQKYGKSPFLVWENSL